ncbi:DEKNAAC103556 [Brettanomyces naardenensis]|uniref:DEKNAAC103556 n=1 Tax=Brettanomyces naardenensis TaxID=13370 RepID=A0A448YNP1_BRENA|nr:DEKNAAC103556 [Brettanomyces naardenensis]
MASNPLGEVIYSAVKPIIRMYMIILTGFFLARVGLLGVSTARALSDLALIIFMPALIFDKVVNYISISDIKTIGVIVLSAVMMYCLNAIIATGVVLFTPVPKTKTHRWVGGALLAGIMQNVSDLPIAYLQAMSMLTTEQSEKGTAYVIIWLAMYVTAQFNCGLFQLVETDFKYMRKFENDSDKDLEADEKPAMESHKANNDSQQDSSSSLVTNGNAEKQLSGGGMSTPSGSTPTDSSDQDINDYTASQTNIEPSARTGTTTKLSSEVHQAVDSRVIRTTSITDSEMTPVSPTSTLSDAVSLETESSHVSRRRAALDPRALVTKTTSRASRLFSPSVSHPAVARIPSARSFGYYEREQTLDEAMNPVSLYSDEVRSNTSKQSQQESLAEELVREYSRVEPHNQNVSPSSKIVTETQLSSKDLDEMVKKVPLAERYKVFRYFLFFVANFKKPSSILLVVSLLIALVPWLKALFVNGGEVNLPNAPDKQPALSFILMYAEYLGQPCVPLGLLLIGSILGRLEVSQMPKGFWKCVVVHTLYRLCILPIIGILWVTKLKAIHWLDDPMSMLVTCMEFALPSATVQIYITASCMRPGVNTAAESGPMNCLALYMIVQYFLLVVTMPIVVCYTIDNVIDL